MTIWGVYVSQYSGLFWGLGLIAAWSVAVFCLWCMCRVSGKADEMAARKWAAYIDRLERDREAVEELERMAR